MLVRHDEWVVLFTNPVGEEEASARTLRTIRGDGVNSYSAEEKLLGNGLDLHTRLPVPEAGDGKGDCGGFKEVVAAAGAAEYLLTQRRRSLG